MQEYNMPYNAREFSSPDPLNDSLTISSPTKRRYVPKPRNSFPLQESSPTKQVFELNVGDKISSQKIKVTVEAEHSEKENSNDRFQSNTAQSSKIRRAPVTRRNERTITTTVPVKGLSESEDDTPKFPAGTPKRGRGRPRKSISSPGRSRSRTRAATPGAKPACKGRKTLGSLVGGGDKNEWDFAISTSDEISKRKGRSRSKKGATPNKVTSNAEDPSLSVKEASGAKSRGRRKTLGPEEVLIFEDNSGITLPVENGDIGQNKQDKDVITQTEASNMPVPSTFSTIRSTTTISDDTPDILLTIFDQAKPTPAKAGWSSPNVVQDFGSSFHNTRPDTPSLPLTMPHGIKSQLDSKQDAQRDYIESGDNVENAVRELREFDTILESEGFSMISVDSVPSLREHFSSPLDARHINEGNISGAKEQFFVEGLGTTEVVTPSVGVSKPKVLYSKLESAAGKETPFSSVPSRVLEAATPKINLKDTKSLSLGLSEREMTGVSLAASKPEVRKSSTAAKGMENKTLSALVNHMRINDDSFSSIPSAILEAATPARHLGEGFTLLNGRSQTESGSTAHSPFLKISTEAVVDSTNQTPSSSRLLTPEDTPSPPEASPPHGKDSLSEKDAGDLSEIGMGPFEGSSIMDSYVKSSPPVIVPKRYTYTAHLRQQHILHPEITETPSIVFSSPALPPPMKRVPPRQEQGSREVTSALSRPVLSPIVREGRALQDIALPAAPRANTQNIHRTSSQHLSSGTSCKTQCLEEKRRANNKLAESRRKDDITGGDDTGEGLQKSFMIDEGLSHNRSTNLQLTKCCDGASQDVSISSSQRNISTAESDGKLGNNSEPPSQNLTLYSESHEMANKEDSVIIDSAMSWQLEDTVTAKPFTAETGQSQVISISTENGNAPEDEEEDIWQVEARHSSSVDQSRGRGVESREKSVNRPRRSKIPSSWRKNSKRFVYSDELAKSSTSPSFENKAAISKAVSNDKSSEGPIRLSSVIQTGSGDEDILEPSIVWNLPQKSNFSPKPQAPSQLSLSALLATSPTKEPSQGLLEVSAQDMSLPGKNVMTTQLKNKPQIEANLVASSSVIEQVKNGEPLTPKSSEHENSVDCFADSIKEHETESGSSLDESQMGLENSIQSLTLSTSNLSSSPAKSCLRNSSVSARKSAAFTSTRNQKATDSPLTPSTPPLSATSWSKAHWKLLDSFYQDSKIESLPCPKEAKAGGKSKYLGMKIVSDGTILVLQQWHLDIVARFMYDERVAPGWDEGIIAKRLFAIIVGEERRAKGEI